MADEKAVKRCGKCKEVKSVSEFSRARLRSDGLQYQCKKCNKAYRTENRERCNAVVTDWYRRTGWEQRLQRLYGVPIGWYAQRLAEQGGGCAICGAAPAAKKRLMVDHDRTCCPRDAKSNDPTCGRCVRGLLCSPCNVSLGHLERWDWRAKAQQYIALANKSKESTR
ncbi:endonuclease domain-containing protein [Streptomyces sp. 1222.5]|uniref:endonuclease domain-containing protein n=1 Tax=Streptomyces sp. 1222.5 TaxID=1881026 RepID=UPI003D713201